MTQQTHNLHLRTALILTLVLGCSSGPVQIDLTLPTDSSNETEPSNQDSSEDDTAPKGNESNPDDGGSNEEPTIDPDAGKGSNAGHPDDDSANPDPVSEEDNGNGQVDDDNVDGTDPDLGSDEDNDNGQTNPDDGAEDWPTSGLETTECSVVWQDGYSTKPGAFITLEWDVEVTAGPSVEEVYLSFFSGWSPAQHYVNVVIPNTGTYDLEIPEDLDPTLEYHAYLESAADGARTTLCWSYVQIEVEETACDVAFDEETYAAAPGETVTLGWDLDTWAGKNVEEVYLSFHSDGGAEYYLSTVVPNTGSYELDLPADLDPTLSYNAYVESAADGARSTRCWDYTEIDLQGTSSVDDGIDTCTEACENLSNCGELEASNLSLESCAQACNEDLAYERGLPWSPTPMEDLASCLVDAADSCDAVSDCLAD